MPSRSARTQRGKKPQRTGKDDAESYVQRDQELNTLKRPKTRGDGGDLVKVGAVVSAVGDGGDGDDRAQVEERRQEGKKPERSK